MVAPVSMISWEGEVGGATVTTSISKSSHSPQSAPHREEGRGGEEGGREGRGEGRRGGEEGRREGRREGGREGRGEGRRGGEGRREGRGDHRGIPLVDIPPRPGRSVETRQRGHMFNSVFHTMSGSSTMTGSCHNVRQLPQ